MKWLSGCLGLTLLALAGLAFGAPDDRLLVFVGTYTGAKSEGIYAFRFDPATGGLTPAGLAAKTESPSFLVEHPNKRWVFAVNETDTFAGQKSGGVTGFSIDAAAGRLTPINQQPSEGGSPCHLAIDATGRFVFVANYNGGNLAVLPIDANGRLGRAPTIIQHAGSSVNKERQAGPHAHAVVLTADNRYLLAADLGLDRVLAYRFSPDRGDLTRLEDGGAVVTPGAGPRHIALDASARHLYTINEINSTVTMFDWNAATASGTLRQTVSTLPDDAKVESTTAEIEIHPSGRFLYGSNRGHDSIAVFAIDTSSGRLTRTAIVSTRGKEPRHFSLDPSGRWLIAANQNSDSLAVFRVDQETGGLAPVGDLVHAATPVCVLFVR
jgi:6-phosphogluconolactonase